MIYSDTGWKGLVKHLFNFYYFIYLFYFNVVNSLWVALAGEPLPLRFKLNLLNGTRLSFRT